MRFQLCTHMSPEIEIVDGEESIVDNGPVGVVIGEFEFAYPAKAHAADADLRAALAAAGFTTERGFASLDATVSWKLVGGGFAALNPI